MSKDRKIKEIKIEIRFFKMQLAELLLESGVLMDLKRLAISINLRRLEELEQELIELLNE